MDVFHRILSGILAGRDTVIGLSVLALGKVTNKKNEVVNNKWIVIFSWNVKFKILLLTS